MCIDMPFDRSTFDGSLRLKGRELKVCRGVVRYGISACEDLDEIFQKELACEGTE